MTSCPAGHPLQTKTFGTRAAAEAWARAIEVEMDKGVFVSRAAAESTTLKELLERYLAEITPQKKGAAPEAARLRAFVKYRLAQRFVAGIHGLDIARFRDERLGRVSTGTVKRDLVILGHVFEVARKESRAQVHNPVRDIKLPNNGKARDRRLRRGGDGEASEEDSLLEECRKARKPSFPLACVWHWKPLCARANSSACAGRTWTRHAVSPICSTPRTGRHALYRFPAHPLKS
jgi:hypothetical protein